MDNPACESLLNMKEEDRTMKRTISTILIALFSLVAVAGFGFAAEKKAPAKAAAAEKAPAKADTKKDAKADAKKDAAKPGLIDVNTATKQELMSIPGVGEAYSQKIIDGRPYKNKTQLKTKGKLPADVYEKIKDKVVAKQK
jgi:DNA uptake protein ComE-like DNA-binding protein